MKKPVVHLFHLGVNPVDLETFHQAGVHNLTTSYQKEAGTLAMYASSLKDIPTEFIVFEVYADEAAYQTHRNSPQYQAYVQQVGSQLTKREAYEATPIFLEEKLPSGQWIGPQYYFLKFAQIEVKETAQAAFEKSVLTNMQISLKEEAGVLAMYALKDHQNPQIWYFYEVYANAAAYAAHGRTKHFQTYLAETKDLLISKTLLDLENDTAVTKGQLAFS
ncbi:putative quinol monooxygenase [Streptococcus macacae]|uniref:Antibiotic biosynthesis monooxygenase n=1 Tax=Streptococcus macacae NCTC 11558 TaxID=764298 RepID=G5JZ37_9STRE|nr:antibiotic biosynthesis monooxygenase [Streptococcus macacae]EHJ52133.1 antibiotic biosynthesis monooxygenase [Streptococcus macacae NCTC 11558]SUN78291.1 antibiotic biosynthesis monooxygenase [Streptococcus macacae NCTC 11558]